MIIPSWLMDSQAGFFINMDKVKMIEVMEDETIRGQERITRFYVKFVFDDDTGYVPPGFYESMEDAAKAIESLVNGLSEHAKSLLADAIGGGMFKRDVMLNNAMVKAREAMKKKDEGGKSEEHNTNDITKKEER